MEILKNTLQDRSKSDLLELQAIRETRMNGKTTVRCPNCGQVPIVKITGMYGQRVRVRCDCGYLSRLELGI